MEDVQITADLKCYHCGQSCEDTLWLDDKAFCCYGCKTIYEILDKNDLCEYYNLDKNPGNQNPAAGNVTFAYLDEKDIRKKVIEFDSENFAKIKFFIPGIHCVSCIWLLENLHRINPGILKSEVNFAKKLILIEFDPLKIKLSQVAAILGEIGYPPQITLNNHQAAKPQIDKKMVLKLTVAGFCFGNVMLFSFPEYLGLDESDWLLMRVFSFLNLALAIPVFFFSAFDYIRSAWQSFKDKQINVEVPIAAGLLALFLRSSYDILTAAGPGYLDSFTGLVFFLLIGRWFQGKTYESLAFDRDFTSYFPLAVNRLVKNEWVPTVIYQLKTGDRIRIRNMEVIPSDSSMLDESAYIDYSFVTGESKPVKVKRAERVYAGGRLIGPPVTLMVEKETSQSNLTSLWNNAAFKKNSESQYHKIIDKTARTFTWIVLLIALGTFIFWEISDPSKTWLILTSVLMVACPCALALAAPFTFGSMLRVFGKNNLYLKNADVIERMANIDSIVFDKTGTITHGQSPEIKFTGHLNSVQLGRIKALTSYSTHPLSDLICKSLDFASKETISDYKEFPGKGIQGVVNDQLIKIGSEQFVSCNAKPDRMATQVFVSINGEVYGSFNIKTSIRKNLKEMINRLGNRCTGMLSGDNKSDMNLIKSLFNPSAQLLFSQSPHDKLKFIKDLQLKGKKVLMIGDGLNDSGALKQSDVGIGVTDDTGVFTPACDGILLGGKLDMLDTYLDLAKSSKGILKIGFCISFFYNVVSLSFAATGHLTPFVAAILMPLSSISVVVFSSLAVNFVAKQKFKMT